MHCLSTSCPSLSRTLIKPSEIMRTYLIVILIVCTTQVWAGTATINIDTTKPGLSLNPSMYGIFLEEINHGVDGGLYAELIANRAFEDSVLPKVSRSRTDVTRTRKATTLISRSGRVGFRDGRL